VGSPIKQARRNDHARPRTSCRSTQNVTPCQQTEPAHRSTSKTRLSSATRPPSYREPVARAAERGTSATLGLRALRHWGRLPGAIWGRFQYGPFPPHATRPRRQRHVPRRAEPPPHRTSPATPLSRMDGSASERPLPVSSRPASVQNPVANQLQEPYTARFNRYELEHPCRSGPIRTIDTGNEAELTRSGFSPFRRS
jgi:hypothetical protein